MTNKRFIELFDKRRKGYLSESEAYELNEWLGQSEHNQEIFERLNDEEYLKRTVNQLTSARHEDWLMVLEKFPELNREQGKVLNMPRQRVIYIRYAAAAAAIILIGVSAFWLMIAKPSGKKERTPLSEKQALDVPAPEQTRARLTLANGKTVYLDSAQNGQLASQGNVNVVKLADGQIAYQTSDGEVIKKLEYNTLSNPRGSKVIDMMLSDGSHVWLNSGSSITYPIAFVGDDRKVRVDGEAYFEVAHDQYKPFIVSSTNATKEGAGWAVQVLGTHFNVNAYNDEADIRVTLLEGSVKVSTENNSKVIKPGEQAAINLVHHLPLTISRPDPEQVMAWKNGTFYFSGESVEGVMKQLTRWYNMEVEYEGEVQGKRFWGMISRNKNLDEVLKALELSDVHFMIRGKKIIVTK